METRTGKEARLTQKQRELVASHLGLVGVDVRRRVRRSARPRCDREWDELFQEGCLGLIEAALRFREARGIPFAAFALPRIHCAVSRALMAGSSPVRLPVHHARRTGMDTAHADVRRGGTALGTGGGSTAECTGGSAAECAGGSAADCARGSVGGCVGGSPVDSAGGARPGCAKGVGAAKRSPTGDPQEASPDQRHAVPGERTAETVGQRLRGKYERAVRLACERLGRGRSGRRDRRELIRTLVEEWFLIPQEASRRSLRQIARETGSSCGRVSRCHRRLVEVVGSLLRADREFGELVRRIRTDPEGVEHVIDDGLEDHLARVSASELVERLPLLDPVRRAQIVDALMCVSGESPTPWVRGVVSRLPADARERVMRVVAGSEVEMGTDSSKRLRSDPRHGVEVGHRAKGMGVGPDG